MAHARDTHNITRATNVRTGNAQPANRSLIGVPVSNLVVETITPAVADADGAAASQTVTGAGTAFILNGALASAGVVTFDVPRNVVGAWTNTAIITITGKDKYGATVVESSASGTSHAGAKAFKTITSITTNATITGATVGSGDVLGLSYRPVVGGFIRGRLNEDTADVTVYVAPLRTTSTATSADVRGTVDPQNSVDGTNVFTFLYVSANGPTDADAFGIPQFAG